MLFRSNVAKAPQPERRTAVKPSQPGFRNYPDVAVRLHLPEILSFFRDDGCSSTTIALRDADGRVSNAASADADSRSDAGALWGRTLQRVQQLTI